LCNEYILILKIKKIKGCDGRKRGKRRWEMTDEVCRVEVY
jgi:hypothetical protein